MPRSSDDRLLFRDPAPTRRPFMVGRLPSNKGGRTLNVSIGFDQNGQAVAQASDVGAIRDSADPFFYLCVFGGTLEMSQNDMHECVDELVYTRQKKARENPRDIATAQQLKQKRIDLWESVRDAQVGRKRFAVGGINGTST